MAYFKYSYSTWFILLGMIISGTARSIIVKLAYQSGFKAPLTVTLLSFLGKSLSFFVYWIPQLLWSKDSYDVTEIPESKWSSILDFDTLALSSRSALSASDDALNGSQHGLTSESEERIKWVHRVPHYIKPAIPAVLNLLASALRWTSLVYIDASVVEMMVAGLELTLSVVAARVFRKRMVAYSRWAGVAIVAAGVIIIERGSSSESIEKHDARDVTIGVILIVIQSILSVFQDLSEELFMQASGSEVPATQMLGVEGFYGFAIGAIIYTAAAPHLTHIEDIDATYAKLVDNTNLCWWLLGLPLIFFLTGLFNIKATERTSAMTRNVWKTLRTVLVWVVALSIFYVGGNPALGEAWHTPESFIILSGFIVMTVGIFAYYSFP